MDDIHFSVFKLHTSDLTQYSGGLFWEGNLASATSSSRIISFPANFILEDPGEEYVYVWNSDGLVAISVYEWSTSSKSMIDKYPGSGIPSCGTGGMGWLHGDIDGDGDSDVIQIWASGIYLAHTIYSWSGSEIVVPFSGIISDSIGFTSIGFLVMNVDGGAAYESVQLWNSSGNLAIAAFQWNESTLTVLTNSVTKGPSSALNYLVADIDGDGRQELIQLAYLSSSGELTLYIYEWNGSQMAIMWQGTLSVGTAFLHARTANIDANCADEILILKNLGLLAIDVYKWSPTAGLHLIQSTTTPIPASFFLNVVCDVDNDGKDELIQLWNNDESLGIYELRWILGIPELVWNNSKLDPFVYYSSAEPGDINNDNKAEIVGVYDNSGQIGCHVFSFDLI